MLCLKVSGVEITLNQVSYPGGEGSPRIVCLSMRDQEPGGGGCLQLYDFALPESHVSPVTHGGQLPGKDTDDFHSACHIQNSKLHLC